MLVSLSISPLLHRWRHDARRRCYVARNPPYSEIPPLKTCKTNIYESIQSGSFFIFYRSCICICLSPCDIVCLFRALHVDLSLYDLSISVGGAVVLAAAAPSLHECGQCDRSFSAEADLRMHQKVFNHGGGGGGGDAHVPEGI